MNQYSPESLKAADSRKPPPKVELSPFDPLVKHVFPRIERRIPERITANQVTVAGHVASAFAVVFLVLSPGSPWWCAAAAVMIFAHWFADTLDGPMARVRGATELGHYLDHFGDALGAVTIGLAIFMTPGSHLGLGVGVAVLYLLMLVHTQIRAEITGVIIVPRFGPTELHLTAIVALLAQMAFDYGRPLSWLESITGDSGALTSLLGFETGLTLIDYFGVLVCVAGGLGLLIDAGVFAWSMRR